MNIQSINNTNFRAQLWAKNNLAKFQSEKLVKEFAERTKEYPDLILEQKVVSGIRKVPDTFILYCDGTFKKSITGAYDCYGKHFVPETLLEDYLKIFNSMVNKAKEAGLIKK